MPLATYKDLCIDAAEPRRLGAFYAAALGLQMDTDDDEPDAMLTGPTPRHTVFLNPVAEPKTVKNRVHLDVHAAAIENLTALGSTVLNDREFRWVVLADPEGQEFCAFVREQPPAERLYEIVVDCTDPEAIAPWWGNVFGVEAATEAGKEWWWLENLPGVPFDGFSFVPVPEPKTAKNRVHWDLRGDAAALLEAGARMVLPRGEDREWDVLADPDGNEFCVFAPAG